MCRTPPAVSYPPERGEVGYIRMAVADRSRAPRRRRARIRQLHELVGGLRFTAFEVRERHALQIAESGFHTNNHPDSVPTPYQQLSGAWAFSDVTLCSEFLFQNSDLVMFRESFILPKYEAMVPRGGIEPPTRGFSIRCSTI